MRARLKGKFETRYSYFAATIVNYVVDFHQARV